MHRLSHHYFGEVQVRSPICPHWVILELSGQTERNELRAFQLWKWLFSQRLVTTHITRSRDVYSRWGLQSRWHSPRWAFSRAWPQRFDCPTIRDSLVNWDRSSYPGGLFSCDSLVDHSFDTMMHSPSGVSQVRGIWIVMTFHQASCFS